MPNKGSGIAIAAAGLLLAGAGSASAQAAPATVEVYEREMFRYGRDGRADPFRSLLNEADLGVRIEDLSLVGVMHHSSPGHSVAVIAQLGSDRRIRARVGEQVGGMRVLAIRPRSVDVLVEEFGIARRETLELKTAPEKGGSR